MSAMPEPSAFPVGDPQFWIVTLVAFVAVSWIAWKLLPKRLLGRHRRAGQKHATLTVSGKPLNERKRAGRH
jgi:hypothetical protein